MTDEQRRSSVVDGLRAFAAADAERGREFARSRSMHSSDAAAVVEILTAEAHGQILTPARLAERIGLSAGATSTLLNRLEAAGHVVRTHDHPDRRIVGLCSTPQIHDDAEAFFAPVAAALEATLSRYTAEQLDLFAKMIADLNTARGTSEGRTLAGRTASLGQARRRCEAAPTRRFGAHRSTVVQRAPHAGR